MDCGRSFYKRHLFGLRLVAFVFGIFFMSTSQSMAVCTSPAGNAGDISYSSTQNVMAYCNGTVWISMGTTSSINLGTMTIGAICTATTGTQISCTTTTVPVSLGGTGTSTQFTQGSVIFAGASGIYSQNNANFFWDNTNYRLGIGTSSPQGVLHVNLSSSESSEIYLSTLDGQYAKIKNNGVGGSLRLETSRSLVFQANSAGAGSYFANSTGAFNAHISADGTANSYLGALGGNLGVGTSTPSYKLQVQGGRTVTTTIAEPYALGLGRSDASGGVFWLGVSASATPDLLLSNVSGTEVMRVTNSGNIGIGISNPAYKLQLTGGRAAISTVAEPYTLGLGRSDASGGAFWLGVSASATPDLLLSNVSGTEVMRVTNSGRLGIGTTAPGAKTVISNNTSSPPAILSGTVTQVVGADGSASISEIDSFGGTGQIRFRRSGGTAAAPVALAADNTIGLIGGEGYYSNGATGAWTTSAKAVMNIIAAENWTSTAQGTYFTFETTNAGATTRTEKLRITSNGSIGISTTAPASLLHVYGGEVQVGSSGTACSATNGGAIRFSGSTVYYCDGTNTWQAVAVGGGSSYLGTSVTATSPSINGDATTGLYTAGAGLVDVAASGVQIAEFGSTGINIATGSLRLAGVNGLSFPADYTTNASIAIGSGALAYQTTNATTTQANVAVGYQALGSSGLTTNAKQNTAIGYQALLRNTSGYDNTAVGYRALDSNTTGINNSAYGLRALDGNTTGASNTAIGYASLLNNASGDENTSVGSYSMYSNSTGLYNAALGAGALQYASTGWYNVAVGEGALRSVSGSNLTGNYNTAVGNHALYGIQTTAASNTAIGYNTGATLTTGTNNIMIGANADVSSATAADTMNIGNVLFGTGMTGTVAAPAGYVGIGTPAPVSSLHVASGGLFAVTGTYGSGDALPAGLTGAGTRMFFYPQKAAFRAGYVDGTQWDDANIGDASIALGGGTATGAASVAIGYGVISSGNASMAFGSGLTKATGDFSSAFGFENSASGTYSTAFGTNGFASGNGSTTIGVGNEASGTSSTGTGYSTTASGGASLSAGYGTWANSFASTAIGQYNVGGGTADSWVATDPIFEIGIGTADTARANAVTVLKSGNVGIGSTIPVPKLDIVSNISPAAWNSPTGVRITTPNNVWGYAFQVSGGASTNALVVHNSGKVMVGAGSASDSKLTIQNDVGNSHLTMYHSSTSTGDKIIQYFNSRDTSWNIISLASVKAGMDTNAVGAVNSYLNFSVAKNSALFEAIRINSDGNIGVGTATPASRMHVYGGEVQVGSSGTACSATNGGAIRYASGAMYYCDGTSAWTAMSGGGGSSYLGTALTATNPSINGDATTGLYTAGAGLVDVAASGVQIAEFGSTGINIATGSLRLAGVNGLSFPADYTPTASIAIGSGALAYQTASATATQANIAMGYQALGSSGLTTAAVKNTAVGYQALQYNTSGTENTAVGYHALYKNITGTSNTAFGYAALSSATFGVTGGGNTAIGKSALTSNRSGSANTGVGDAALYANSTGVNNVAVGQIALQWNTSGSQNVAVGVQALRGNVMTGDYNTAVGHAALINIEATAANNTALGYNTGTTMTIGTGNILIGANADVTGATVSNTMNIGNIIFGTGMTGTVAAPAGYIGIGTSAPVSSLHVASGGLFSVTGTYGAGDTVPASLSDTGPSLFFYPRKAAFRAGYANFGTWADASVGDYSIGLGAATTASGEGSVAIGYGAQATGLASSAFGAAVASGNYSSAMGQGATADGYNATAVNAATATGSSSFSMGDATTTGTYSTAMGEATAAAYDSVALGRYNVGGGTAGSWVTTDPLFEIGIGTADAYRANAMTVLKSGNVGIGSAIPVPKLDIVSNIAPAAWDSPTGVKITTPNSIWGYALQVSAGTSIHALLVHNSGKVMVGSGSTSDSKLTIQNDVGNSHLTMYNSSTSTGDKVIQYFNSRDAAWGVLSLASFKAGMDTNTAGAVNSYLTFSAANNSTLFEAMRVTSSGSLGIGTTAPASRLHVYGGEVQVGSSGAACSATNGGAIRYDAGYVYYCDGTSAWQAISVAGAAVSAYLGTSAAATNPSVNGDATTGLYTAGAGLVDVAASGVQIAEFASTGLNIATGSLRLAGVNGLSFPTDYTPAASIAIGSGALAYQTASATETQANIAMGYQALGSSGLTSAATDNVAIGYMSLWSNTSGSSNTALGHRALQVNTSGSSNAAFGLRALGNNTTGSANTAVGYASLLYNSSGQQNTAIGNYSMYANTSGLYNTAMGVGALQYGNTSSYNTAVGEGALKGVSGSNLAGDYNTAIGNHSLYGIQTTAANNTALGYNTGATLTTGTNNIMIGANADVTSATAANTMNIGNIIFGTGMTGTVAAPAGYVGIGISAPEAPLHIYEGSGGGSTSVLTEHNTTATDTYGAPLRVSRVSTGDMVDGFGTMISYAISDTAGVRNTIGQAGFIRNGADNTGRFEARPWTAGAPTGAVFALSSTGYAGIGTTAPVSALHVATGGIFSVTGTVNSGDTLPTGLTGAGTRMFFYPRKAALRAGYVSGTQWDDANIGSYSVAFGNGSTASGSMSVALGGQVSSASANYSAVVGGYFNSASAQYSGSFGGYTNEATGSYSLVAGGSSNEAARSYSAVIGGYANTAYGDNSAVLGGYANNASGYYSAAVGYYNTAAAYAAFAIGRYNVGTGTASSWVATDPLFEIGIGTASAYRANAMTVLKNGKVGIGTATPASLLHVYGGEVQVGSSGAACSSANGGAIRYDSGAVYYCDGTSTWTAMSGGGGSSYLGTSVTATNPSINGDATTGLYTAGAGLVDVAASGVQIAEFGSTGINIATGSLKLAGVNGLSFPADYELNASIAIGSGALAYQTASETATQANIALGYKALGSSGLTSTAVDNLAIGSQALTAITTGYRNIGVGNSALRSLATGYYNTAVGYLAGANSGSALQGNTYMGYQAGLGLTGNNNVMVGVQPGLYASSLGNSVAIGNMALAGFNTYIARGVGNVAIGQLAMNTVDSNYNIAIGGYAMYGTSTANTGGSNTAVGLGSLYTIQGAASGNVALGYYAGHDMTTGSNNIFIGNYPTTGVGVTTGANNIMIGYDVRPASVTADNQLNIGNLIYATSLASGATNSTGLVGIGTAAPASKLHMYEAGGNNVENTIQNSGARLRLGVTNTDAFITTGFADALELSASMGTAFRISGTTGYMGIGTSIPATSLQVATGGLFSVTGTYGSGDALPAGLTGAGTRMFFYPQKAAFRAGYVSGTEWDDANIGEGSIVLGGGTATGPASVAIGYGVISSGNSSIAFGSGNTVATGDFSSAFGFENSASGNYSTAFGTNGFASGSGSTTIGVGNEASGVSSISTGYTTTASGDASLSAGYGTWATSFASTAIGRFNVGSGTTDSWVTTDPIFEIGIGADSDNRANAVTVLKNGNVGIGSATPANLLELYSSAPANIKLIANAGAGGTAGLILDSVTRSWQIGSKGSSDNGKFIIYDVTTPSRRFAISADGNIRVGSSSTDANARLMVQGSTTDSTAAALNIANSGDTSLLYVRNDGVVGIATTSPASLLHVYGGEVQVGSSGATCSSANGGAIRYASGSVYYCDGTSTWTAMSGGGGSSYLGTSVTATSPSINGDATTGLYTAGAGLVDVAAGGVQIAEFGSTGINIAKGSLKLAGVNGLSFPPDFLPNASIAIGSSALAYQTVNASANQGNIALGYQVLGSSGLTTAARYNVGIGTMTLQYNTSGNHNTALGVNTLGRNTSGASNTAVGAWAMSNLNNGQHVTGSFNTAVGYLALSSHTSSSGNTAVGTRSMSGNTTGQYNAALGAYALYLNVSGDFNAAVGEGALRGVSGLGMTGDYNTAMGPSALENLQTTSTQNTAIGYQSGNSLTVGNYNILVGANADVSSATVSNFMNIGNIIFGTGLNGTVAAPAGLVGIGTAAPAATLDVNGAARLAPQTAAPLTCSSTTRGSISYASVANRLCICDGTNWIFNHDGSACTW